MNNPHADLSLFTSLSKPGVPYTTMKRINGNSNEGQFTNDLTERRL
jgi:hypothetical protein